MTEPRTPTDVDAVAEEFVRTWAAHDPLTATNLGIPEHQSELPALTPEYFAEGSAIRRRTLAALRAATPVDAVDRITVAAMRENLEVSEALRATGAEESDLKNLASPAQNLRDVFDLMPTASIDDWATIAARMSAVGASIDGYIESLRFAARIRNVSARRQVEWAIKQSADNIGTDGFFSKFAREAAAGTADLPATLRADLDKAATSASAAYERLGTFLRTELLPQAREHEPIGRELYTLHSRSFLGTEVDLAETYAWGQQELARIVGLMAETAERIKPGATVREAMQYLDTDPDRKLRSTDELRRWMQRKSDEAIAALADTHFDIPQPIRVLECRIAPTQQGGIYYTGPSDDLTRPGRMWWSVPKGDTEFSTWRELTTVYHEGVPGHHLQIAQTAYRRELLNLWRRLMSWMSGHGEGWALYAERLMADLGFLDDPAEYLGMLDGQQFRAARVVIDIGMHCEFDAPAEVGGGAWTWQKAWDFLSAHVSSSEGVRRFELTRYFGWPGQAPAYKVGERMWLQLRDDARALEGAAFDLKAFHRRALDIGSLGLDVLRGAVLGTFD
ncbi:MAG TPA: DUF885 domain-containing protein [Jatrophihabitantaceae bacterium]|nr:DUF885 domain-containing protein [Jatrophihabitantaceae bacterium]